MKYKLEHFLAFNVLKKTIWDCIKDATITEDFVLEFTADLKSKKGSYKRKLIDLLHTTPEEQFREYIYADMRTEGYMLITTQGGWVVVTPKGEEYQLTEHTCTCREVELGGKHEPCKHLIFKQAELEYRAKVQLEKTKRGL